MELIERVLIIKKKAKQQKITQQLLAELSKIPKGTICSIFRGESKNPRIDTIEAMEKALNINQNNYNQYETLKIQEILSAMKEAGMSDEKIKNINKEDIVLIASIANEIIKNRKK